MIPYCPGAPRVVSPPVTTYASSLVPPISVHQRNLSVPITTASLAH
ncbi:unnamed protein product, partial [Staurois parvus]